MARAGRRSPSAPPRLREKTESMAMQRHSILVGKCYRDSFGAIYRIVGFDGNIVQCVLYHRTDRGLVEREHSDSWADFLDGLQSEVECPPAA
jgi:hypothetical protein